MITRSWVKRIDDVNDDVNDVIGKEEDQNLEIVIMQGITGPIVRAVFLSFK
jgi:endonuclease V-like protein UPF0215 family